MWTPCTVFFCTMPYLTLNIRNCSQRGQEFNNERDGRGLGVMYRKLNSCLCVCLCLQQSQYDSKDPTFSLQGICEGSSRWQAATTFFCFLVLKKQEVLRLCQTAPYEDISATPGPKFYN